MKVSDMSGVLFSKADKLPGDLAGHNKGLVAVDGEASAKVRGNSHVDLVQRARTVALAELVKIAEANSYLGYVHYQENVTFSSVGNHAIVSVTAEAVSLRP
jgi:hypothetical protein